MPGGTSSERRATRACHHLANVRVAAFESRRPLHDVRLHLRQRRRGGESACTPDSAPAFPETRRWRPSLSAGGCPPAPAAYPGVSTDGPSSPCVALLPVGFAEPPGSPRALVRSYRT